MKSSLRYIVIGAGTVSSLFALWFWQSSRVAFQAVTTSEIVIDPSTIEIQGDSPTTIKRTVRLKNRGTQAIRIDHIETTCGCTVADRIDHPTIASNTELTITISATPPAFWEKSAYLTIYTTPRLPKELRVPVVLRGRELEVPFVTQCPKEVAVTGETPNGIGRGQIFVQTVESSTSKFLLTRTQYERDGIRIWADSDPSEESLFGNKVRRNYVFQVSAPLPETENQTTRSRHALMTSDQSAWPGDGFTLETRLVPVIRIVPSIVNLLLPKESSKAITTRVVLIDSRTNHDNGSIKAHVNCSWIHVDRVSLVPHEGRSVCMFEVVCNPAANDLGDGEFHTDVSFQSAAGNELAKLPISVCRK